MNTASGFFGKKRFRREFGKFPQLIDIPDLIEVQKRSYDLFLQADADPHKREVVGLEGVFKSVFPISDFNNTSSLNYDCYVLETPKYDIDECRSRGMSFAAPLKVTVRLEVYEVDEQTGTRNIKDVKEQEVYLGEIPLMTSRGSFIINGTERVVVSQLHRSPGVFFDHDKGLSHSSGKLLYSARIIPYRGSWLDFEFDHKDILYVRIDRRRKLHVSVLLKALGYSVEELLHYFYEQETVYLGKGDKYSISFDPKLYAGQRASQDWVDENGKVVVEKNKKFTTSVLKKIEEQKIKRFPITRETLVGKICSQDVIDLETGEVLLECNEEITEEKIDLLVSKKVTEFKVIYSDRVNVGTYFRDTLVQDKVSSRDEAIIEIYRRLRPGDPPTLESARTLFDGLFFDPTKYDLSRVGRLKINHKFGFKTSIETTTLTKEDIMATVKYLIDLKNGKGTIDDIDHLGNRRVRAVGELLENQFRVGLVRMERAIRERMSLQDVETLMPHDLINAKPVSAVVKEFFGSSQLSQFMDQTNPLSEVTHKRRLSALGPGGLTRERAGFEVRDVHATHYGRICPIETPEGPNIGLISSLSTYGRVNEYGFIETPYRQLKDGKVTEEVTFYSALEEENHTIASAKVPLKAGKIDPDFVSARKQGEVVLVRKDDVDLMDVAPNQLVSIAASLVPFLENDDANRALMGANMQRQAVPLLRASAPLVGTGMERLVARDSGVMVIAKNPGVIDYVDATRIVVRIDDKEKTSGSGVDIYNLVKYRRSNQNTCINQKPIVEVGERVERGDVLADGPSTDMGDLALGQNIVVAFMPWGGYNFEDSILLSEELLVKDTFTSVHIEEFECVARDTKLGKEEVTRDIPNVSEEQLMNLDSSGIVRIGAEVKPGDILVGKITPKGETQLSPEEKLLRAIFGEKAGDVKDTSLRVSPGIVGTVIGAQVFSREGADKDERTASMIEEEESRLRRDEATEVRIIQEAARNKVAKLVVGQTTTSKLLDSSGENQLLKKGDVITQEVFQSINYDLLKHIPLSTEVEAQVSHSLSAVNAQIDAIRALFDEKVKKLKKGDELPPGVIKMVKVYVAIKRKIAVGDKMAGRHGNKGVVSRVLPVEDMPYMENGTPVQVVLNPLGVPSRMNVGQILESHLGRAAYGLGVKVQELVDRWSETELKSLLKRFFSQKNLQDEIDKLDASTLRKVASRLQQGAHTATPVFDSATETEISDCLKAVGLPENGQQILFDGRTGEPFKHDVTVGVMYVLKLHHLVDEKIHARSIGPYSLVTQQPLGGKAQFGGQRLGEMEVWALEAYGAAYCLQELLTVKSDDVAGRTRMFEAIVKGENVLEPGLPESFNVLVKELQSLAL
ncbi:MAG: DNA-directed RNA polymerase subunit beta, partial [Proteobacteria bacterium]|nr:DNA-directed RNA polymerase subunit beta [Pseudomonadota bacterium]